MSTEVRIIEFDHDIIEHLAVRTAVHGFRPAYAVTLANPAGTFRLPFSGKGVLLGYSIMVPGVAAGVVSLFDGQDGTGQLLAVEAVGAAASITRHFGPDGLVVGSGLAMVTTQPVTGVAWVRTWGAPVIG